VFVFNEWCAVDYDLTDPPVRGHGRGAQPHARRGAGLFGAIVGQPPLAAAGRCAAPLFDRQPRGLEPTRAGEALLRHARQVFASIEQMHAELSPMPAASAAR
jgi:hypothetical protein